MTSVPRKPGEIRVRDRVITLNRSREIGYVVAIDGDTAQVVFAGCGDKLWPTPLTKLARHWLIKRRWSNAGCHVEAQHPEFGMLPRGIVRAVGVKGMSIRWQIQDYDASPLPDVVGDYVTAERLLLEQTAEADGEPSLTEEAAAKLVASLPAHNQP